MTNYDKIKNLDFNEMVLLFCRIRGICAYACLLGCGDSEHSKSICLPSIKKWLEKDDGLSVI